MTSTILPLRALILFLLSLVAVMRAAPLYAATDVRGTWSGTFSSNHSGVAPFTISVVVDADSNGHLVGNSTLNSHCLKGAHLQVTVTGSTVVLAGSDKTGNNMTLRGSLDDTGTLLKSAYIFNGSVGGGCETDDGTGTLTKR
jgi:nitrous oxidase accessory protein NosD